MQELIGQTLGQYKIAEKIGQGGMAAVFKAWQPGLERWVAVKVLPPFYAADTHFSHYFMREARAIAQLEHPHILPVYDFGQQGPYIYLVMRYIEGSQTLADVMSQPFSLTQALTYLDQVATALDYAHQRGVIHRDIKPTNILLSQNWVFLADFGLARSTDVTRSLTMTGMAMGTPAYMSPEQGSGDKVDARTDIYALGVIIYELLTGQIPHVADTAQAIIYKRNHEPAPSLRQVRSDLPKSVAQVVQKALAPNPAQRFGSAGELVAALRQAIQAAKAGHLLTSSRQIFRPEPQPEPLLSLNSTRICPHCGATVALDTSICPNCGELIDPATIAVAQRQAPPPWWLLGGLGLLLLMVILIGVLIWVMARPFDPAQSAGPQPGVTEPGSLNPTPTSDLVITADLFFDEFNGVGLDQDKWAFLIGGGQIQVYNSLLRLTSGGQTFPVVYPKQNPFPIQGNFRMTVTLHHLDAVARGTGFRLGVAPAAAQTDESRAELLGERIIDIWQDDQGWRVLVGAEGTEVYRLSTPAMVNREVRIDYVDNVYHIFLDGAEIYISEPTTIRPTLFWFGNPAPIESAGAWSGLEIERVAIASLAGGVAPEPTPVSEPTSTLAPTPTFTLIPETPMATTSPLLGQDCERIAADFFIEVWRAYRGFLGCPRSELRTLSTIAEETFQGGHLFWIEDTDQVYIIYDRQKDGGELLEGRWELADPDWKWDGSNPEGVGLTPPPGLVEPRRGFGWLWRTHLGGPEGPLGWALDREYGFDNVGRVQVFEQGLIFRGSFPKNYVLLDNGTFYAR